MLKAVRFDPETHNHLLTYIDNYRDNKGKPNHSEAIRVLMEKGYESLQPTKTEIQTEQLDVNSIKSQVYTDIMEELNKKFFSQMGVQQVQQVQHTNLESVNPIKKDIPKVQPPKPKQITKPIDTNSIAGGNALLANLIGNANR